jgi:UDP-galactopyranose mutase
MPKKGFTSMFTNMINNRNITVSLNTDFKKIKNLAKPKLFTIYTGCPDEYFDYKFGKLDWRSLRFSFKNYKKKYLQDCVQYNFPNEKNYTRSVEIKHVTKQRSNFTVISREYPTSRGDPYYPINTTVNIYKFNKYKKLILKEEKKNVFFEGRLATYRYLNTDEVIEKALLLYKRLKKNLDVLK